MIAHHRHDNPGHGSVQSLLESPGIAGTWMRFWFTPMSSRPLAAVRIAAAFLGLLLLWSYAEDMQAWFGPAGVLASESVAAWRSPFGVSLFDLATTSVGVTAVFVITVAAFALLLVGLATPVVAILAAVLWASLLNRGPMLAGPADDVLAVLLWCLAIGPAGEHWSIDRLIRGRFGAQPPHPSWRARVALGLVQLHAAVIAIAAALSQLKGDAWWNGTAAWWLAAREGGRLIDLTGLYERSEFVMNAVTHAITLFEILFAAGLWFAATSRMAARAGLVAWPLIGVVAGEPLWGLVMAVFCIPLAGLPLARAADHDVNPLLRPWQGPYGGVPPFDRVRVADFEPAMEAAMNDQLARIATITSSDEPATFANTSVEFERSGRTLARVQAVYEVFCSSLNDDAMQQVERRMAPRVAAFADRIVRDDKLFARVAAVCESRERSGLSPEQRRLAWLHHTDLVRAGAKLDAGSKARLAAINEELAGLSTTFAQNVLADEESQVVVLEAEGDLAGCPESIRAAAAEAARDLGRDGWVITNTRSSVEPFLTYAERRDLREKVWRMFVDRGDGGGATDNNAAIASILRLRAERARLLGFATHAHWRLEDSMAKTPQRAVELMEAVWKPAVARVREEVAQMQSIADAEGAGITIEPWDYRFYAEKVRKATYDLDEAEIKPYLQLEKLREGMFHAAGRLFGLRFDPVDAKAVPVPHPDVRVWEVHDAGGRLAGLFAFDPFARKGKRSGAWMSAPRAQERFDGDVPTIVTNSCNFSKPAAGEPALLSWDDATTLFHEFGHALHGLCSSVEYPSLSGTNVARDYVEFPSQLFEHWLSTPELLDRFAIHHRTGAAMPRELVAKVERAKRFNEGFRTVEFLASALVDMKAHLAADTITDPAAFERDTLADLGMPREIVMRHRMPHFLHIFADDGYSAGYYSYLWADAITADAWEAFTEAGGPWDGAVAARLLNHVLSVGNSIPPEEGYRAFRGRDPGTDALMRKRGFAPHPSPR